MNIQKLIMTLQKVASSSTSALDVITLSKAVEKLQIGRINTVATSANLPINLTTNGNVYYVTGDDDIYYNVGATWKSFYSLSSSGIYGWGNNGSGKIGDNTTTSKRSPVTVVGGITNWRQVSAGESHSLGVTITGIAYAWGYSGVGRGQLGDNTTTNRSSPVTVVGGITTWSQLSAGVAHSLGVTSTGIAYGWGGNSYGRIGDNTTTAKSSPVTVVGAITNWSQVSAGDAHSLGLTLTGIAYAWGRTQFGRLGDNAAIDRSSPVTVVGGITNWSQLAASSGAHSLGVTATGIAYAWGLNTSGRLGDNTTTTRSSPVTVVGAITNWRQTSGGASHSLGITLTGIAYGWGYNNQGQLGDNTSTSRPSPITVVGGIMNWSQISAGRVHSLGVTSAGIAYGWGRNYNAQLGDNTITDRSSPVTVVGAITNWSQLSGGSGSYSHSIGITAAVISNDQVAR